MNFMVGVGVLFNERSISVLMCAVIEFRNYDDKSNDASRGLFWRSARSLKDRYACIRERCLASLCPDSAWAFWRLWPRIQISPPDQNGRLIQPRRTATRLIRRPVKSANTRCGQACVKKNEATISFVGCSVAKNGNAHMNSFVQISQKEA
jgi:hypothetical protein